MSELLGLLLPRSESKLMSASAEGILAFRLSHDTRSVSAPARTRLRSLTRSKSPLGEIYMSDVEECVVHVYVFLDGWKAGMKGTFC